MNKRNSPNKKPANKVEKLLHADFPRSTYRDWRVEVDKQLKSNSFEEKMIAATYEGIDLQPIYNKENCEQLDFPDTFPGLPPYLRGVETTGYLQNPVFTNQRVPYAAPEKINETLLNDLKNGQTAINIRLDKASRMGNDPDTVERNEVGLDGASIASFADIETALNGIDVEKIPLHVDAGISGLPITAVIAAFALKKGISANYIKGSITVDPLGELAAEGSLPVSINSVFDEMAVLTRWAIQNMPNLQTVGVNCQPYNSGGANTVEELAFALASGVEYLKQMKSRGIEIDKTAPQMRFTFSVGSNFFMEIAKLRAVRLLWAKVIQACGGNEQAQKIVVHVNTSASNKTTCDPYVNIIRATAETCSGIIGGCDSMHTGYFDETFQLPDDFSRRISRNIQIVLKEESHLAKVIDPAGGSWYVENLTDALARKAWQLFQDIEKMGGMLEVLKSGFPQEQIAKTAGKRLEKISLRKDIIVGTNMYPNATENIPEITRGISESFYQQRLDQYRNLRSSISKITIGLLDKLAKLPLSSPDKIMKTAIEAVSSGATVGQISGSIRKVDSGSINITPVKIFRGTGDFELIRRAVEKYTETTGNPLKVILTNFGSFPQYKSHADFASGFFETGGFEVINNTVFDSIESAVKAVIESEAQVVVICSDDENCSRLTSSLKEAITKAKPETIIVAVGNPDEPLKRVGIDEFIYTGINVPETLTRIIKRLEVTI